MAFDYAATARRRGWSSLPAPVRAFLTHRAGGRVDGVRLAGGGFTHGFAGHVDGPHPVFAKAVPESDQLVHAAYAREAEVLEALPAGLPVPALEAVHAADCGAEGNWLVLVMQSIEGHMPGRPWTVAEARAIHESCLQINAALGSEAGLAARLRPGSMVEEWGGPEFPGIAARLATGRSHRPDFLPDWFRQAGDDAVADLAYLASLAPAALRGNVPLHNDLRADNVVIGSAERWGRPPGTAWICDWNWLSRGPAWADWVALFPYFHHAGLPVEDMAAWRLTEGAEAVHLDSWLALLCLYMIDAGAKPELASSPRLRAHGRFTARITIGLLAERRGWTGVG